MRILILCLLLFFAAALCAQDSLSTCHPGDNPMFLCPTAHTPTKGAKSLAYSELVFLEYTWSPYANTEFSIFSLVPVVPYAFATF